MYELGRTICSGFHRAYVEMLPRKYSTSHMCYSSKLPPRHRIYNMFCFFPILCSSACGLCQWPFKEKQLFYSDWIDPSFLKRYGEIQSDLASLKDGILDLAPPTDKYSCMIHQIVCLLKDSVIEPLLTGRRLIHLFLIYLPVLLTSPMLMLGYSSPWDYNKSWAAVWWYDQLALAMEHAGPTFLKVAAFYKD